MTSGFVKWLRSLDVGELAELLRSRPDCASPPPRSADELGNRLNVPHSIQRALDELDRECHDVLAGVVVSGDGCTVEELARAHGVDNTAELDRGLAVLRRNALVWPAPDGTLHLAGPLRSARSSLGLGRNVQALLKPFPVDELGWIAESIGIRKGKRKQQTLDAIEAFLSDPAEIAGLLAQAPAECREIVEKTAWQGPICDPFQGISTNRAIDPVSWLLERALLVPVDRFHVNGPFEMPREVALALRGADYHAPLRKRPAAPKTTEAGTGAVDRTAAVAAGRFVAGAARLLEHCAKASVSPLKSGGVGVRVLSQLAKALHADEREVRLWLEAAAGAELLSIDGDGDIVPADSAEEWQTSDPADQYVELVSAWWWLPGAPTMTCLEEKPGPALAGLSNDIDRMLRHDLVGQLAELPDGHAVASTDELDPLLAWLRPALYGDAESIGAPAKLTWAECDATGVTASAALSSLGSSLLAEDSDRLRAEAARMLPTAQESAVLQADLTAVVRGTPNAKLTRSLDLMADLERRDTASTWRFSPTSIRRAFDQGWTAEDVVAELERISDSTLPQPLRYLIDDVARRFGELKVTTVKCCVVGDEALLAEVSRHKALAPLKLRVLAPTVLASGKAASETLDKLRAAGYSPVQQDASGSVRLERHAGKRGDGGSRNLRPRRAVVANRAEPDFDLIAKALAKGTEPPQPAITGLTSRVDELAHEATQLGPGEIDVLADALARESAVHIEYVDQTGKRTSRPVTPIDLDQRWLVAWCHMRDDERNFRLERIRSVTAIG
ncbi:helicase-associated domain-containing protein [Saccharopolyspora erythraea]|uniref:helicase C-terminal domain-containing protein n=1 Tax=Saccharopolyspora erythraea TaxID=1836 RepID=UPI001BA70111|nr:helicase C-terminal domain-containing protein [Saccharopolyspora erythraea]QUH00789.1 helicase-associated domain-containing protein [Saccharopolyspora erythraea]